MSFNENVQLDTSQVSGGGGGGGSGGYGGGGNFPGGIQVGGGIGGLIVLVLMFVFGYGINLDVENLSYAVLDRDQTTLSQNYALNLSGSRYFVEHMPILLHRVRLFVTADMIGRSLGGVCELQVFVMGTEHAPGLRTWLDTSARGSSVSVGLLGADLLLLDRSDYGPFRSRKVPFLFFTTGENPVYHRPDDVAETVNYATLEAISRIILGVVRQAADADDVPGWKSVADNPFEEAATVREVIRTLLKHKEALKIGAAKTYIMGNTLRSLDAIAKRGAITPEERAGMVRAAQIVLASLF